MHLILIYILMLFTQAPVPPRLPAPEVKFFGDCDRKPAVFINEKFPHEILYLSSYGEVMFWTFGTEVCLTDIQLPKEMQ